MVLRELQTLLGRINDVESCHDVYDFLITDRAELSRWHAAAAASGTPEALLVEEEDGGVNLALFLDAELLRRLAASAPFERLDDDNLEDFCTALEGVSHFSCVTWCAARARPVSVLVLEMQAEIDKYAASVLLAGTQRGGGLARGLHARLFEHVRFRDDLADDARRVYDRANRYAARFCRRLEDRFLRPRRARVAEMLAELRQFYRLDDAAKLRAVEAV
jgi:predicted GNAT superfamily acetyltransferase